MTSFYLQAKKGLDFILLVLSLFALVISLKLLFEVKTDEYGLTILFAPVWPIWTWFIGIAPLAYGFSATFEHMRNSTSILERQRLKLICRINIFAVLISLFALILFFTPFDSFNYFNENLQSAVGDFLYLLPVLSASIATLICSFLVFKNRLPLKAACIACMTSACSSVVSAYASVQFFYNL